ncbi:glucose-1-phosphate adenylyltransferase family protein [Streptomyces sp. E-15]
MVTLDGVRAALLAGGLGQRMGPLTADTCKPMVPYAASCRLVDFSLANAAASGVGEAVLLSLHRETELAAHVLEHWDDRAGLHVHFGAHESLIRERGLPGAGELLPARPPERGTADALLANAPYLFAPGATDILVLHADHVYRMDYGPMLEAHRRSGADCTIGVQAIDRRWVRLFGMVEVDDRLRVLSLIEKPEVPTSDLVFTAFCLFRADTLREVLSGLAATGPDGWQHDISRDVLPAMIAGGRDVRAFPAESYWADIGTVERYHQQQLRLLAPPRPFAAEDLPLTLASAPPRFEPRLGLLGGPTAAGGGAGPADVVVEDGAVVTDSVLHPGSSVAAGATVERSVVLPGAVVGPGVRAVGTLVLGGEHLGHDREGLAGLRAVGSG